MSLEGTSGSGSFNGSVSSNDSLHLCAARSLSMPHALPILENVFIGLRSGQFIYNLIILVFGITLNSIIIRAPRKNKKLRTIDMAIAVHITLLNLSRTLIDTLLSMVNGIAGQWVFGASLCTVQGFFMNINFSTRRNMMLALAVDRFLLVFSTFTYPKCRAKVVFVYSIAVWVLSFMLHVPALPGGLDCYSIRPSRISCFYSPSCSSVCSSFGFFIVLTSVLPSYTVPMLFFGALYWKGRKSIDRTTQQAEEVRQSIRKANLTFFLLFVTYFMVSVPTSLGFLVISTVTRFLRYYPGLGIIQFLISHAQLLLVVLDALVILRNRDIKEALIKSYKEFKTRLATLRF